MGLIAGEFGDPDGEYTGVCCMCGHPLTPTQIAADFQGKIFDYIKHDQGECRVCFCCECYIKLQEFTNGGPEAAVQRLNLSISLTRQAENGYPTSTE